MKKLVLLPLVILLLVPVIQATALNEITVSTDKKSYSYGDHIKISGTVNPYLSTSPVDLVIWNPQNSIVVVTKIYPNSQNMVYYTEIVASGNMWTSSGKYQVQVADSANDSIETSFDFDATKNTSVTSTQNIVSSHGLSDQALEKWVRKNDLLLTNGDITPLEAIHTFSYLVEQGIVTKDQTSRIFDKIGFIDHVSQATAKCIGEYNQGKIDENTASQCIGPDVSKSEQTVTTPNSDNVFSIKVLKCDPTPGGEYIDVGGQITNNDLDSHRPELVYQGKDKSGEIVTFELGYSDDISPGQTVFVDRLIKNDASIDSCSIHVNQAN